MGWRCDKCEHEHDDEELPDVGCHAPDPYLDVPQAEREERTTFTEDRCTVEDEDGEHYFIRGVIEIPIHGTKQHFGLGAWVSQSKENYLRYAYGEKMGPTFGWLVNRFAHCRVDTYLLETRAHFRAKGIRPRIVLAPSDHPLVLEQQRGISFERAWEIVHHYMPN